MRLDCHLHTVASGDATATIGQLAARARDVGLDALCVTDHNLISAAVAAADAAARGELGVRIIVGEEIRTPSGDVIGLVLTERIPYVLPLAEVVTRIRDQGGLVHVPHPFDPVRSSLGPVLPSLCAAGGADVIEVFNAKIADPAGFLAALADARISGEYRPHAIRYPRRGSRLQADPGSEPLAVVGAVAEEQLAGLGPLEVQVGVVLPGEADAAVDLDVLGGHVEVRLCGVGLQERGQHRDLLR
jgi:hypothetical protein